MTVQSCQRCRRPFETAVPIRDGLCIECGCAAMSDADDDKPTKPMATPRGWPSTGFDR